MEWIGEWIGYAAVVASVLIYQQKNRKALLACKAIADILWIGHYLLLGGYTGTVVTGVALVREIVFFNSDRHSKKGKVILLCFLCISTVCSVLTWGSFFSLFALIGSLLSIVSFWIGDPRTTRILSFPVSVCMMIYGISNGSSAVLINELLTMMSSAIALLRSHRKTAV